MQEAADVNEVSDVEFAYLVEARGQVAEVHVGGFRYRFLSGTDRDHAGLDVLDGYDGGGSSVHV